MIDMNKRYQTRDGRPVRLLCVDADGYPVVGLVNNHEIYRWTDEGWPAPKWRSPGNGLIEVKTKREGWINIYKNDSSNLPYVCSGAVFISREQADRDACDRIACVKIEWEE